MHWVFPYSHATGGRGERYGIASPPMISPAGGGKRFEWVHNFFAKHARARGVTVDGDTPIADVPKRHGSPPPRGAQPPPPRPYHWQGAPGGAVIAVEWRFIKRVYSASGNKGSQSFKGIPRSGSNAFPPFTNRFVARETSSPPFSSVRPGKPTCPSGKANAFSSAFMPSALALRVRKRQNHLDLAPFRHQLPPKKVPHHPRKPHGSKALPFESSLGGKQSSCKRGSPSAGKAFGSLRKKPVFLGALYCYDVRD